MAAAYSHFLQNTVYDRIYQHVRTRKIDISSLLVFLISPIFMGAEFPLMSSLPPVLISSADMLFLVVAFMTFLYQEVVK